MIKLPWKARPVAIIAAVCGLALAGCSNDSGSGEPKNTIDIGAVLSQSGVLGKIAPSFVNGAKLAVAQMNASGGLTVNGRKYHVKLDLRDDRSDPSVATSEALGLVNDQGVKFMLAESDVTAPAVTNIALPRGVLLLTPAASMAAKLTSSSVTGQYKTLFATNSGNADLVKDFESAMKSTYPDAKSVGLVFSQAPYGQQASGLWKQAMQNLGLKVDVQSFPANATDISTVMARVKAENPDVVIGGGIPSDMGLVVHQSIQLGATYDYLAYAGSLSTPLSLASGKPISQTFANTTIAGDIEMVNGKVFTSRPSLAKYVSDLRSVLGVKVNGDYANGLYYYDWTRMLGQAIEKAGTVDDPAKVAEALAQIKYQGGAIGNVSFSPTHTAVMPPDVCTVKAGKIGCKVLSD